MSKSGRITAAQAERFRRLAWPFMGVVLRTAQILTRDSDQAEDLAQETMMKAARAIDSYEDDTDMKAWLLTILRRTHIDRIRAIKNKPRLVGLESDVVDTSTDDVPDAAGEFDAHWQNPEALLERFDDQAVIESLKTLPDDLRWTLLLTDVEQMPQADVAKVLDVAVGTVKSRTHRARSLLRDQLYHMAQQRGWLPREEAST